MNDRLKSIHHLIFDNADKNPDKVAIRFLKNIKMDEDTITYGELKNIILNSAKTLKTQYRKGDRVLLIAEPGIDFVCMFFATQAAGLIAIPTFPPINSKYREKIEAITQNATPAGIVVSNKMHLYLSLMKLLKLLPKKILKKFFGADYVTDFVRSEWMSLKLYKFKKIISPHDPLVISHIKKDDIALLQYTSGSTNAPKGVILTHYNLAFNCAKIRSAFKLADNDVVISWLPPYHDMGLIGNIMVGLSTGLTLVLISPEKFLNNPLIWLKAISKFGGKATSAPNFAYGYAAKKIAATDLNDLNLSSLKYALNGSEPIKKDVMELFSNKFSAYGFNKQAFCPCYGLAEATLFVSSKIGGDITEKEVFNNQKILDLFKQKPIDNCMITKVISCGVPYIDVIIVNPEKKEPVVDGVVGEVWISGDSMSEGYWGYLAHDEPGHHCKVKGSDINYFRTGDLGFIADGELYISGRIKDLICISGANYYAHDLEHAICWDCTEIKYNSCAVLSEDSGQGGRICIIAETHIKNPNQYLDICNEIKKIVLNKFNLLPIQIDLIAPKSLHRTTSGKIQRSKSKTSWKNGEYKVLHSDKCTQGQQEMNRCR